MFYITSGERPPGWVNLSNSNDWVRWIQRNIPDRLDDALRRRLTSNLKHILVGLELKKALIEPHAQRANDHDGVLYEPYFQNLIFEFCVGSYSVFEGLGAAHWLDRNNRDGTENRHIRRDRWRSALCAVYDSNADHQLDNKVMLVTTARDKLHQDEIGARNEIDWHALGYDAAFTPANRALETVLRREPGLIPEESNLAEPL